MQRELKKQLDIKYGWLENDMFNYNFADFLKDIKELTDMVGKLSYLELLSKKEVTECEELLTDYLLKAKNFD